MRAASLVIAVMLVVISASPAPGAPRDYAALRKAADAVALKKHAQFRFYRADLTAVYRRDALEIEDGSFQYLRRLAETEIVRSPYRSPIQWGVLEVEVESLEAMHLLMVGEGKQFVEYFLSWSGHPKAIEPAPVPENVVRPEEALRRMNRSPLGDPNDPRRRFGLQLLQVGAGPPFGGVARVGKLSGEARGYYQWVPTNPRVSDFFARTAPHGRWIWWTIVEQEGVNPRSPGARLRVSRFIYVDAITGHATSACVGLTPDPIHCP